MSVELLVPVIVTAASVTSGILMAVLGARLLWSRKNARKQQHDHTQRPRLAETVVQLASESKRLQSRIEELEASRAPSAEWFPEPASMHLNHRGQVLRLHRRGESAQQIASSLHLSQGEVQLIVKVHELSRAVKEPQESEEQTLNPRRIIDKGYTGLPGGGSRI